MLPVTNASFGYDGPEFVRTTDRQLHMIDPAMSGQQTIHFLERVDAPIEHVFAHFADHHWFVRLFGGRCRVVAPGAEHPNGVGSVRRIGVGPLSLDETIVAFEPGARIDYQVTRGPLRDHLGQIEFREEGGQVVVDYHIRFEGRPGFVGPALKKLIVTVWKLHAPARLAALQDGPGA